MLTTQECALYQAPRLRPITVTAASQMTAQTPTRAESVKVMGYPLVAALVDTEISQSIRGGPLSATLRFRSVV